MPSVASNSKKSSARFDGSSNQLAINVSQRPSKVNENTSNTNNTQNKKSYSLPLVREIQGMKATKSEIENAVYDKFEQMMDEYGYDPYDGFTYRKADYMDSDGQYYSMTLSIGKNGEINSIYNLGKIKEIFTQTNAEQTSLSTNNV